MPLMAHHAAGSWSFPIPVVFWALAAAIFYFRGLRQLARVSQSAVPVWRPASFLSGLILIGLALSSRMAALDHQFLTAHMVEHLLLMTVAPALVLLGDPVRALFCAFPSRFAQEVLGPVFHWPPLQLFGRFLANPVLCWLAASVTLIVWHVPSVFVLALQSPALHLVETGTFLVSGFLFWWPVLEPWPTVSIWPRWPILFYLFLATIPCDILSAYLTFCDSVVYPSYLTLSHASEVAVLRDQQLAGSLMWTSVTLLYLIPAAILTVRLLERPPANAVPAEPRTFTSQS